jgi:class 3 adenylate cyclase
MYSPAQDIERIRARILHTIKHGLEFDLTTDQCKQLLRRHVNSNTTVVVLFIDINDSTRMSISLPPTTFASLVQIFSQEARLVILGHGGYVLKYVGDSIIGIFPAEYDNKKASENALNCALSMMLIIRECINPIMRSKNLPEIAVKIGLEHGPSLVILYGKSLDKAPIDLVGPCISMASKIMSAASPNQILVGQSLFAAFSDDDKLIRRFTEIQLPADKWNFHDKHSGNIYKLYNFI